jgi:WD40 repeat protein
MISAAVDGSIAAWDFRQLTSTKPENGISQAKGQVRTPRIARSPAGKLYTHKFNRTLHSIGPVHLCEGLRRERKTALCLGSDAIVREWDYQSGCIVSEQATGHCDTISRFVAVGRDTVFSSQLDSAGMEAPTATISASWDGTVRMRSMVPQKR